MGFQTGDIVKAHVLRGKYTGKHTGRIAIRHAPNFNLKTAVGMIAVHPKTLTTIHKNDGYTYSYSKFITA